MKPILVFFLGLIAGVLIMVTMCLTDTMPIDCGCTVEVITPQDSLPASHGDSIKISDAWQMINSFETDFIKPNANPERYVAGVYGGRIGRKSLELLLRDNGGQGEFINFKFGFLNEPLVITSPPVPPLQTGQVYLIMSKGILQEGVPNDNLIIKTSGEVMAFCPPKCAD